MIYKETLLEKAQNGFNCFIDYVMNDFNLSYNLIERDNGIVEYEILYNDTIWVDDFIGSYAFDENGNYKEEY